MDERYETLRRFLHGISAIPMPKTESGVEYRILKHLFTPEQAEAAICLTMVPEPAKVIAARMGKDPERVSALLEQMVERCVIRPFRSGDTVKYQAVPWAPGLMEMSAKNATEQYARDYMAYLDEALGQALVKSQAPLTRTIPIEQSIASGQKTVPYEQISEIIAKGARPRAVQECWCRDIKERSGGHCEKHISKEVCISFGPFAQQLIDSKQAREIDDDEFRSLMAMANDAGLIPQVALNTSSLEEVFNVCNCCSCCCGMITSMLKCSNGADFDGGQTPSSYVATIDEDGCTRCEECLERCQTSALVAQGNGIPQVIQGRCLGCGLCTTVCNTEAIRLARRKGEDIPDVPGSMPELFERIFAEKNAE